MRTRAIALGLLALITPLTLEGLPRFSVPSSLLPGSVNTLLVWDEKPVQPFLVEVRRAETGKLIFSASGLPVDGRLEVTGAGGAELHWAAALLSPDVLDSPGPVTIRILGRDKTLWAEIASEVKLRDFPTEVIALDPVMSTLRSKPDPRKDRESAAIWALYQKVSDIPLRPLEKFLLPVDTSVRLSAHFGDTRRFDYSDGTSAKDYHHGTDFAVPVGTPVKAPASATVVMVADRLLTGTTVVLEHGPGLYSVYFHLSKALVTKGQVIRAGEVIALSGATGLVTGPHLHWEVRSAGVPVDPFDFSNAALLDTKLVSAVISSSEQAIH